MPVEIRDIALQFLRLPLLRLFLCRKGPYLTSPICQLCPTYFVSVSGTWQFFLLEEFHSAWHNLPLYRCFLLLFKLLSCFSQLCCVHSNVVFPCTLGCSSVFLVLHSVMHHLYLRLASANSPHRLCIRCSSTHSGSCVRNMSTLSPFINGSLAQIASDHSEGDTELL